MSFRLSQVANPSRTLSPKSSGKYSHMNVDGLRLPPLIALIAKRSHARSSVLINSSLNSVLAGVGAGPRGASCVEPGVGRWIGDVVLLPGERQQRGWDGLLFRVKVSVLNAFGQVEP